MTHFGVNELYTELRKSIKKALGNRMKLWLAFSSRNYFENRIL